VSDWESAVARPVVGLVDGVPDHCDAVFKEEELAFEEVAGASVGLWRVIPEGREGAFFAADDILGWISSGAGRVGAMEGEGADVVHEGETAIVIDGGDGGRTEPRRRVIKKKEDVISCAGELARYRRVVERRALYNSSGRTCLRG
jgi:hypothetical protein